MTGGNVVTGQFNVSTKHNRYLATGTSAVEAVVTVRVDPARPAEPTLPGEPADAVESADPSDSATWPDVRLRVWTQAGAQVTGLRQLIPDNRDLQSERRAVGTGTWEHPLGAFTPGEERTYHLRLVDVGEHRETAGLPHAVGRVSVHLGPEGTAPGAGLSEAAGEASGGNPDDDGSGGRQGDTAVARSTIEAVWSDDPDALAERDADFGGGTMQQFMAGALADARHRAAEQKSEAAESAGTSRIDQVSDTDAVSSSSQAASDTSEEGEAAGSATVEFPPGSDASETRPDAPPTSPPTPKKSGKGRPRRPAAPAGDRSPRPAPPTEEHSAGPGAPVTTPPGQPPKPPAGGARGRPRRRPDRDRPEEG